MPEPTANNAPSPSTAAASHRLVAAAGVTCLGYALVRYVVLGPVPLEHAPLFVTNKAAAFSGVVLFAAALISAPLQARRPSLRRYDRGVLARAGGVLAVGHALASLVLLGPPTFPALFGADGRLTGRGEIAAALGVVSTVALVWQAHRAGAWRRVRLLVLTLAAAHAAFIGWPGWWAPATWHGGLPPITLLSALIAVSALVGWGLGRRWSS